MRFNGSGRDGLGIAAFQRARVLCCGTVVFAVLAATGCTTIDRAPAQATATSCRTHPVRDPAVALLDYAHHLAAITPDGREAAVNTARDDIRKIPNATEYARLAIALGTPGQRLYTPDEAARYAQLALDAQPSPWTPAARQYLTDYARLYTQLTNNQTKASTAAGSSPDNGDGAANDKAEIDQLRSELDDAHRKLRALAHIEERLDSADSGT
ncbi:MAG: hypothetical protein PF501_00740 [Salinisphaera sp.]|jgi:hypothetical protein|nr:hypothetical protein [Salinisphaera sp.]